MSNPARLLEFSNGKYRLEELISSAVFLQAGEVYAVTRHFRSTGVRPSMR